MRSTWARHSGLVVPVCIIGAVLVVIAPLPAVLMDLLLAANITLSVVILLTTTQVRSPLQFSVFPSLLLGTTLARLVLNIATTRLILTRAATAGTDAAGGVVAGFGDFVTAGSPAVGLILFLILLAIQFFVITRGATRISEVAARFALDGMPGRQMAIEADLASGALTAEQARAARQEVARQSDFYGSMDGASKFVRGDAVAGLVITLVNIIGGLTIGVVQHGMSPMEAAGVFTTLTIGDGLVSQLPAFLIAVAAGLLVTRTSQDSDLSRDAVGQTFAFPVVLYAAAAMLVVLAFTGLPMLPMLCLGMASGIIAWSISSNASGSDIPQTEPAPQPVIAVPTAEDKPLFVPGETEPLALELGLGLLALPRQSAAEGLLHQLGALRQRLTTELGFVIPKMRIRDNLLLGFREFRITLDGQSITSDVVDVDGTGVESILRQTEAALRQHSHELLNRPQVHQLVDHMRARAPQLVEEVIPHPLKLGQVHHVLTELLREQVSIRNLESILGTLADVAHETQDITQLTDAVRSNLGRSLCGQHCRSDGSLPAIVLDPMFEASLAEGFVDGMIDLLVAEIGQQYTAVAGDTASPVLICRSDVRSGLQKRLQTAFPKICVLSRREVPSDISIDIVAEVGQSLLTNDAAAA